MNKVRKGAQATKTFFGDVVGEMRKSSWPERRELFESTIMVIVLLFVLGLFVGVADTVLIALLKLVIPVG